jgi:hypothetical protein
MAEINRVTDLDFDRPPALPLPDHSDHQEAPARTRGQFAWLYRPDFPEWGRGRDDAMNLTKYFMIRAPMDDTFGPTDMPSVWNLKKYVWDKGHRMNYAGDSHDPTR